MNALAALAVGLSGVAPSDGIRNAVQGNPSSIAGLSSEEVDAYLASYVGMHGNPAAPVWLCDITPKTDGKSLTAPLNPLHEPVVWDKYFRQRNQESMMRWQSHQKAAKLISSARSAAFGAEACDWKHYFMHHLYGPSGGEFRISLFPLPTGANGNRCWARAYRNQPALNPQSRYLSLCRTGGRFRFIAKLRQRMQPKVIVCIGACHADDFLRAFEFSNARGTDAILQPADLPVRLQVFTQDNTTLVISPAFGGVAGLNSDVLLSAMGRFTAQWLAATDFPSPLEKV
ncbi:transcriptional regulator [Cupriavidus basilensis]|uniref:transcriptional regulator n=1 Tax=Cupriavidus basilensis TaxID=68895 RepID=UPI0023E82BD2|nr:transcriptional regulator [Cupriavidus basilensis]MDF3886840.1 transcriptional regulator [Cupriavidus basilensis]